MAVRKYGEYLKRKRAEYGQRFDPSDLAPQFIRYFESGERIRVRTVGLELTGTIGVTSGWKPAFLLMRTARSIESPWILSAGDSIVARKREGRYVPIQ